MTEDAIRREMDFLHEMLGTWDTQINAIAEREANSAFLQQPFPYENHELQLIKEKLVARCAQVVERLQALHNLLVSPAPKS
jgi:nucleotidyltransferase/DNA polymerase involved in DNA repair